VRRPHPRFAVAGNAWVIRIGGRLTILGKGPKYFQTEATTWDAFDADKAQRGAPIEGSTIPALTLGQRGRRPLQAADTRLRPSPPGKVH